ncbi:hypothetical protein bcere0025_12260 [Bacillus cereus F65185]|nr:hypothetical protein H175_ch1313 [Bacillus thuringiensis serovar thuringiensis str. IS5056]EEK63111.1 hypothetical protein bcere0005_12360 [Bacillus cereus 172560W]EEL66012.1 hypothetical protein bcere0025_12260 [Bacillus cereus F65185]EEM42778.1 hypothetical protein bthur0004_12780 [Bacillus thuringiensis serovar sotto str. T04001]KLA34659.1 hypothetical protein B4080_1240 [Bacillus cereus]
MSVTRLVNIIFPPISLISSLFDKLSPAFARVELHMKRIY